MLGKHNRGISIDKILIGMQILFIIIPVVIFFWGWTKWYIAISASFVLLFLGIRLYQGVKIDYDYSIKKNIGFWTLSMLVIFLWVLFSGIGNFSYQTGDYIVRNPMFRDLYLYDWPIYYDLSLQPDFVKSVLGNSEGMATYVYYFAWWLPIALISKITGCSESLSNIFLLIWAVLCLFLVFYCLVQYLKKFSYWVLATYILFAGMDAVMWIIRYMKFPTDHLEWWANYFQYSANTTQIYWVFNQSIPIWMIVSMLLLQNKSKSKCGLSALAFAYSPFATIGMIPIAIGSIFNGEDNEQSLSKKIVNALTFENIAIPILILVVFGSFYMQSSNSLGEYGFIFCLHPEFRTFTLYAIFIFSEVLIYFIAMGSTARKFKFYWITLFELLTIPLFKAGLWNDFCMRVSIPALFLLMILILQTYFENQEHLRRRVIQVLLIIGFITSLSEINRNLSGTLNLSEEEYINELVYSFGDMQTDNEDQVWINMNQYMPRDFQNSFFYRYIAKN